MARPDTAGFYYYGPFYGHSKTQIVPGGDDTDPVDNPTTPRVPCDDCPSGYDCENDECVKQGGPTVNPDPLNNPTVDTQCRTYTGRGNGIKTTASGVFSGYDANSGGQWTFKCEAKITFYGRLNHSASSGLTNDIRWGVGNHVRSFVVPADSIDEQSIFKFTEYADGEYKIEIKRKSSGDTYYDWQLYQQGKLEEADGETLYVGVSAGAEIWKVMSEPTQTEILFSGEFGIIKHDINRGEITITYTGSDPSITTREITIADKNVGASSYSGGQTYDMGDKYRYGASSPSGSANEEDWANGVQSMAGDGFHIPTANERITLINTYMAILNGYNHSVNSYLLFPSPGDGSLDYYLWLADSPTTTNTGNITRDGTYGWQMQYTTRGMRLDVNDQYYLRLFKNT